MGWGTLTDQSNNADKRKTLLEEYSSDNNKFVITTPLSWAVADFLYDCVVYGHFFQSTSCL